MSDATYPYYLGLFFIVAFVFILAIVGGWRRH